MRCFKNTISKTKKVGTIDSTSQKSDIKNSRYLNTAQATSLSGSNIGDINHKYNSFLTEQ